MSDNTETIAATSDDGSTENGGTAASAAESATPESAATGRDVDGLAAIADALGKAGLAPEGDYDIASVTSSAIAQVADLTAQVAKLKDQLKAAKKQASTAKAEAAALDPDAKARKLPDAPPQIGAADRADFLDLIGAATRLEIVAFSDGTEITSIPALVIDGPSALQEAGEGLVLTGTRWVVYGRSQGDPSIALTSWGLYADDTLVAWRERPSGQLTIAPGASFDLSHEVIL